MGQKNDPMLFNSFNSEYFLFFIQQYSANIGQRYRLPILNNIVFNILPNDNYLEWFKEKEMPCIDKLKKEYSNLDNHEEIYSLYSDSSYTELFDWIVEDGKTVYMKFLITHPYKTLLFDEKSKDLKKIFAYNLNYTGPIKNISWASHYIFPLFNAISILLLLFFFIFLCIKEKSKQWLFPSILIIVFTLNALILYNADKLEVERHLLVTNIIIQFIGIYLIILIINSNLFNNYIKMLLNWIKSRKVKYNYSKTLLKSTKAGI